MSVLFGERVFSENKTALFFDKNGTLYPDYLIADSLLMSCSSSLDSLYLQHENVFLQIGLQYNCHFNHYSSSNARQLQDSIMAIKQKEISSLYANNIPLTFFIHGFRKSYTNKPGIFTSVIDYRILEDTLNKLMGYTPAVIKVFWDGMYSDIQFKHYKKMLGMFVQSQSHAINVGRQLRLFLNLLPHSQLNFISHSLGARVLCTAMFDTIYTHAPTPSQKKINLCLIAPAIAENDFENYYTRNTSLTFINNDNYRLLILYNKKDFVLKKRDFIFGVFGPGPRQYGKTTLGCNNRNAICQLETMFSKRFTASTIKTVNMTKTIKKCHHLRCYCAGNNLKSVVDFIKPVN